MNDFTFIVGVLAAICVAAIIVIAAHISNECADKRCPPQHSPAWVVDPYGGRSCRCVHN